MKITTSRSYNVFSITPTISFISEKNYRDGGLAYAYLAFGWGYWSIDLVIKQED